MTIPTLISKCQKVVLAKQAQKEYATWTQAFKRILADNTTTSLTGTDMWTKVSFRAGGSSSNSEAFWTELGKYIKLSPSEEWIDVAGSEFAPIYLPSGAYLESYRVWSDNTIMQVSDEECAKIKALGGSMCSYVFEFYIDVNGAKGPNEVGRDLFGFYISDDGTLYPYGGKDYALYESQTDLASNTYYWKNVYNGTKEENAKRIQKYRAGQLMEEGWKMNY
jgi:hypothetical protein